MSKLSTSRNFKDETGKKYGSLRVLRLDPKRYKTGAKWLCHCKCGNACSVLGSSLRNGDTVRCRACGYKKSQQAASAAAAKSGASARNYKKAIAACLPFIVKHGHCRGPRRSRTYTSWYAMLSRCRNPRHKHYRHYGGKGITACKRWQGENGFANFLADMGERPPRMTIDRYPNKDGNYEPNNCRWATATQQRRNSNR